MVGKICGTGSYVPPHVMDNDDLSKIVDTNDEWIRERTGIGKRHIIGEETTSYMAGQAALRAVEQSGIDPEEIDMILVATSSSETVFPCAACEVQKMIGASRAVGYDLNAACTGFVLAFNTAQAYISAGLCRTVMVIGADSMSNMIDWTDRSTCILFGDGAGAALLRAEEGSPVHMAAHSDGVKGPALTGLSRHRKNWEKELEPGAVKESYIHMDGQGVFKFAVRKVPEIIEEDDGDDDVFGETSSGASKHAIIDALKESEDIEEPEEDIEEEAEEAPIMPIGVTDILLLTMGIAYSRSISSPVLTRFSAFFVILL